MWGALQVLDAYENLVSLIHGGLLHEDSGGDGEDINDEEIEQEDSVNDEIDSDNPEDEVEDSFINRQRPENRECSISALILLFRQ